MSNPEGKARLKIQGGLEAAVDSIAEAALNKSLAPGLSVAVMRGPDVILAKGYGFADVEKKTPATPDTIYQIGSISKQFTAAAIMRLVEQGRMRLDDPITKYIPDYPTQGHTVLVRHLLHQASGIKEFFTIPGYEEMDSSPPETVFARRSDKPFQEAALSVRARRAVGIQQLELHAVGSHDRDGFGEDL